jgi:HAE1 family hydrophobic/amphiphilic exporter-1
VGLRLFVERPILSGVIAFLFLLMGAVSLFELPIAEYPQITPPQVTVTSTYIGADAEAVESSVTNPLEEQINGVQGMEYMSSTSTNAGASSITITFDPSRDIDAAAVDVQNRVQNAEGQLPSSVTQTGITITKSSGSFLQLVAFTTTNPAVSQIQLSNFIDQHVRDSLLRVDGVNSATILGERRYAMRIWLDPRKLQFYGLGASDVTTAVSNQNVQVPAGSVGAEPSTPNQSATVTVHVPGQLADPAAFGNIVVKHGAEGSLVRLSQVARVELGAQDYATNARLNGKPSILVGIEQSSGSNALQVASGVRAVLEGLKPTFPTDVAYGIPYDTTLFVSASMQDVVITLLIAILLVVATIYLFLQDWRTTIIPVITIPVSLIGTFAFVKVFDFSINILVLFGLTLATGLVVDDAIVVIENIARTIRESKTVSRLDATVKGLSEITSAVVATTLVLLAVFIPTSVISGTTGAIYKQFALTLAFSISISAVIALTLTPALAALLMGEEHPARFVVFRAFNSGLSWLTDAYVRALATIIRFRYLVAAGLAGLLALTAFLFVVTPTGFLPDEDQGVLIGEAQAPDGSSMHVTERAVIQLEQAAARNPNVSSIVDVAGYGFNGEAPNQGIVFISLKDWGQRKGDANSAAGVNKSLTPAAMSIPDVSVQLFNPPSIPGLGVTGGFDYQLEDYLSGPLEGLDSAADALIGAANRDPGLAQVYTTFRVSAPQLNAVVSRTRVAQLGAAIPDVFNDISTALGSTYVNNFTYDNRTYRVYVQNDAQFRANALDVSRIIVPNTSASASPSTGTQQSLQPSVGTTTTASIASGTATVPLASVVDVSRGTGAPLITHYNLYRSIEVQGNSSSGHSSGQAISAMAALSAKVLPAQFHFQWTGISLDESESGSATLVIYALALVLVYLVLAALYENLGNPLVILLAVPAALLGALGVLELRHMTSDVYAQVGYVMLIGLSAKNAILIVEFAVQRRAEGQTPIDAVTNAAKTRLRPILMTSIAFIAGLMPLVFSSGAGAGSRHSLGTAVVGGMLVSTVVNLIVIPAMYIIVDDLGAKLRAVSKRASPPAPATPAPAVAATP